MNPSLFALALMDGISSAALLFLVALGLTLIFGVIGIINVAHGSLYAWGGYFAATLGLAIARFALPGWLALPALLAAALVIGGLLGTVLEFALLRRILDKDPILQLLVTFAAFMVLEDLQRMIWGVQPVFVSDVVNQLGTIAVAGVTYTRYQLLVLPVVAIAAFFGLRWFLGRTALGRQVTAVTHNREVATAMGVNTNRVTWLTIALGVSGLGCFLVAHWHNAALLGLGMVVMAAFWWAVGNLLVKGAPKVDAVAIMAWMSWVPILPLAAFSLLLEGPPLMIARSVTTPQALAAALYLGLGVMIFGYGIWGKMLQKYPASTVAPFSLLVPVFGIFFGMVLFDETLSALQILGVAFLVAAVCVNMVGGRILQKN